MRLVLLFCMGVIATVALTGCEVCSCKTVACPSYSNGFFDAWFPYTNQQTVVFRDQAGSADTMHFFSVHKSTSYDARKGCYNGDIGCNMIASMNGTTRFANNSVATVDIDYSSTTPFGSSSEEKDIVVSVGTLSLQASDIGNIGLINISPVRYSHSFHPVLTLNNTSFTNVQLITRDTVSGKEQGIYKLYLSRGQGIIGYEQYPSLSTSIKQ